jgi:poly-beta-hydroxyalkanoate depolymerase
VASVKTTSAKSQRTWKINTGFRSRDEMLSLRDLLESKQIWIVDAVDSRLMSVTVEAGDFTLFDSMEDLNSLEIKVVEAHV